MRPLAAAVAILILGAAAPPTSPEAIWRDAVTGQNKDYAQAPHAMLKIQDSAYLGDGQTAVLQGQKGRPGSWHWSHDAGAQGVLRVSVAGGKIAVLQNGNAVDPAQLEKSVAIDADVDVVGHPTQVGPGIPGWRIFIYNQQNQAVRTFKGVSYYPYGAAYRVTAHFSPDSKLPPRVFRTSRGTDKQFFHAGDATFGLKGKTVTLRRSATCRPSSPTTSPAKVPMVRDAISTSMALENFRHQRSRSTSTWPTTPTAPARPISPVRWRWTILRWPCRRASVPLI
jgi:hypothetical protein